VAELIENGHEGFVMDSLSDAKELADKINLSLVNLEYMGKTATKKAGAFPIEMAARKFMGAIQLVAK
jgi:hypothetical protein